MYIIIAVVLTSVFWRLYYKVALRVALRRINTLTTLVTLQHKALMAAHEVIGVVDENIKNSTTELKDFLEGENKNVH